MSLSRVQGASRIDGLDATYGIEQQAISLPLMRTYGYILHTSYLLRQTDEYICIFLGRLSRRLSVGSTGCADAVVYEASKLRIGYFIVTEANLLSTLQVSPREIQHRVMDP